MSRPLVRGRMKRPLIIVRENGFSGVSSSCRDQLRYVFVFSFDFCDFFGGQRKIGRADVSLDLLRVARTDDGAGDGGILKRPGDSDLPRRTPVAFADLPQAFNQRE